MILGTGTGIRSWTTGWVVAIAMVAKLILLLGNQTMCPSIFQRFAGRKSTKI